MNALKLTTPCHTAILRKECDFTLAVEYLFGDTMNIFGLSAIASPFAGAVAGAVAVKAPGIGWLALGMVVGLAIGLVLCFSAIGLSSILTRLCTSQKLNPMQWLASLTAILLPAASPFAAWVLSVFVVSRVIHV